MAEPIASDVLDALEATATDVVASDFLLVGGLIAAERSGVPAAALVHTVYPFPARGLPPYGMGWQPMTGVAGRVRDAVGHALFRAAYERPLMPRLNALRRGLGLTPRSSLAELLGGAGHLLVLTSSAFDFPAKLPDNVRYVGAQLPDANWAPAPEQPWSSDDPRPLVVASLTTTYQRHDALLHRIVAALGRLPVRALVTTGGVELPSVPRNISAVPFVPHAHVLPHASVVVTHGGLGTVHAALAAGVPLVCLPIGRDQPDNAARVTARGLGVRLSSGAAPERIAGAVERVLGDPAMQDAARRMAGTIAQEGAASKATRALEELAPPPAQSLVGPQVAPAALVALRDG